MTIANDNILLTASAGILGVTDSSKNYVICGKGTNLLQLSKKLPLNILFHPLLRQRKGGYEFPPESTFKEMSTQGRGLLQQN